MKGPAGTDVKLRFAEVLNPDGTLYVDNLRTAKATDHYILAGKGQETYQPTFTFHGFRYVEISGLPGKPKNEDVQALVFTPMLLSQPQLKTGSAMLNQLWSNILWGQRSNFVGVPTDCPQRDERLGWSADAQVFWRAASYNMDLTTFSRKFGADLRGTQVGTPMYGIFAPGTITANPGYGTGWSDAGVIIPWTSWIQTGDTKIVEENWAGMEKYLAAIHDANPDYLWRKNYGIPFGGLAVTRRVTPVDLIATAYWAYDVTLMKQMAHATGKTADEQKYGDLFEKIKDGFQSGVRALRRFCWRRAATTCFRFWNRDQTQRQTGGNTDRIRSCAEHEPACPIRCDRLPRSVCWTVGSESLATWHGISRHAIFVGRSDGHGPRRCRVSFAAQHGISVMGLPRGSWRYHDVGTLERRPDA